MGRSKNRRRNNASREQRVQAARARLKNVTRATFRRIWSRYSIERRTVLELSKRKRYLALKSGLPSKKYTVWYVCNHCKKEHPIQDVQVDHIVPIGAFPDIENYRDVADWLASLFCSIDNLQVLCRPCHADKTKKDKDLMRRADKLITGEEYHVRKVRRNRKTTKRSAKART